MATPTNYADFEQESQKRFLELQRTLILAALKISYFFDKTFRPKEVYQYQSLWDSHSPNDEQRVQNLKSLRQRVLVKFAFGLHGILDSSRQIKEGVYTFLLWQQFLFKKLNLSKPKDFQIWIEKIESRLSLPLN